jgi:hypothetical protein
MTRVLSGVNEPDEPNRPDPELVIRMTVPEEFAGWSMGELSAHRGWIKGIDVQHGIAVIRGVGADNAVRMWGGLGLFWSYACLG